MDNQSVLERMVDYFKKSPDFKKAVLEQEEAVITSRAQDYADHQAARTAEASDQDLAADREKQARLSRQAYEITRKGFVLGMANPDLANKIHHLNAKIERRARGYRAEVDRLKTKLLATVPPEVESKVGAALQRVEELEIKARELSFEKKANEQRVENGMGEDVLLGFESFVGAVSRLLPLAQQAKADLHELRLTSLTGAELDRAIRKIVDGLPELQRVRYRRTPAGDFIEA